MLKVHSVDSFGTQDGPGIRFVIFLQGCVFRCIYCENADTMTAEGGKEMSVEDLVDQVKKTKPYFGQKGGCTISGGEPTFQAKGLVELFKVLHEEGINTCLDTNGGVRNDDVKELIDYTDHFLLDIKHINPERHKKITGQDNQNVLNFLDYLEAKGKTTRLRYVLVPGYSDQMEYIEELGKRFGNYKCVERIEILPYHRLGEYKWKALGLQYPLDGVLPPAKEVTDQAKSILEKYFKVVMVR